MLIPLLAGLVLGLATSAQVLWLWTTCRRLRTSPGGLFNIPVVLRGIPVHCVLGDVVGTSPISGTGLRSLPVMGLPHNVYAYVTTSLCRVSER